MPTQVANPTVIVNNDVIGIIPNTCSYTEGYGEQSYRVASVGGNQVEAIYGQNIETNISMVKFSMPPTQENIALARRWKSENNRNVVQVIADTPEGSLTRTFTQAAIINDYEVNLGADTDIELEFKSLPAV